MFTEKKPGAPRVALVGCSASKLKRAAPAWELYTSVLFRAAYAYAEKTCDAVLIVSAFYGVVAPKAVIRPYDRSLRLFTVREREQWGARTVAGLLCSFKPAPVFVLLAGKLYADALLYGAHWHNLPRPEQPLTGIRGCGRRVKWLRIERVKAKIRRPRGGAAVPRRVPDVVRQRHVPRVRDPGLRRVLAWRARSAHG